MKITLFAILFLVLNFTLSVQGQGNEPSEFSKTTKIDEFGNALNYECDRGARLDQLAIVLQNDPTAKGRIIIYRGANETFMHHSERRFLFYKWLIKSYLIESRGIASERLEIIDGGFRPELAAELWFIPENGEVPRPTNTIPQPVIPTDKTFLYGNISLTKPYDDIEPYEFLLPKIKAELDEWRKENQIEPQTIEAEELGGGKFFWADTNFGEILKNQPTASGVIIFYADDTRLSTVKVKKHLEEGKAKIAKEAGISPSRIKIVFGGFRGMIQADFWIVPKNVEEPKPTPEKREETEAEN